MSGAEQITAPGRVPAAILPSGDFAAQVQAATGEPVGRCFGCKKCTGGCPVSMHMDLVPHRVIRLIQVGQRETVLQSSTVWICASCRTCEARCPNDINIAHIMDYLKRQILAGGGNVTERRVYDFHRSFLNTVGIFGRAHEITMIGLYKMRSRTYLDDLAMGGRMLARGRLPIFPEIIRGRGQIRRMFRRAGELSRPSTGSDGTGTGDKP